MTREEFYAKYGDVEVTFRRYYKYTFTYGAELPGGNILECGYSGNSDEIYRHEVTADGKETVLGLQPHEGGVYQDGKQIEGFYDY